MKRAHRVTRWLAPASAGSAIALRTVTRPVRLSAFKAESATGMSRRARRRTAPREVEMGTPARLVNPIEERLHAYQVPIHRGSGRFDDMRDAGACGLHRLAEPG